MPRTRWLVVGVLLAVGIVGGVINARGPFAAHPSLPYAEFLADFEAGRVSRIVQWRDQLEITEGSEQYLVVVPPTSNLGFDLGQARRAGGVGISMGGIPDDRVGIFTPWIPGLIILVGVVIWVSALARARRLNAAGHVGPSVS
ncbi:MAG: hypothetical protein HYX54_07910 [Chloroflexi bacterium]|nr:hypothetical protein [Chloroflexota bacterium]